MTRRRLYPKVMRGSAGLVVKHDSGRFIVVVKFYPEQRPNELTEIHIAAEHWDLACATRQMREEVQETIKAMQSTLDEMGGPR